MRYSKSMIEAVKQVAMYEQFDYVLLDKDNKIIARYKGRNAKKQAELNKKGAEKKVGVMKPIKVYPINPGDKRKIGDTVIAIGELTDKERGEIDEDVKNALAGFDNRIRDGGMDRKDFIKAKELYKRKDVKGLRKHIYSLDTSPLEVVMNLVSIQDRPFFDKMYPNTRGGEFLARIAYQHRHLDEKFDPKVDKMLSKGVFAHDKKFKEYVLSFTNRKHLSPKDRELFSAIIASAKKRNIKFDSKEQEKVKQTMKYAKMKGFHTKLGDITESKDDEKKRMKGCLLYTSPSPRDS